MVTYGQANNFRWCKTDMHLVTYCCSWKIQTHVLLLWGMNITYFFILMTGLHCHLKELQSVLLQNIVRTMLRKALLKLNHSVHATIISNRLISNSSLQKSFVTNLHESMTPQCIWKNSKYWWHALLRFENVNYAFGNIYLDTFLDKNNKDWSMGRSFGCFIPVLASTHPSGENIAPCCFKTWCRDAVDSPSDARPHCVYKDVTHSTVWPRWQQRSAALQVLAQNGTSDSEGVKWHARGCPLMSLGRLIAVESLNSLPRFS